jgi:hypothetical protein
MQADGQIMLIQQCKQETVKLGAKKIKCGWEPKRDKCTLG